MTDSPSPLVTAVKAGDAAAVTEALKSSSDALDDEILPLAASLGGLEVFEALLTAGAKGGALKGGWTTACHAAAKGHAEVLAALIAHSGPSCLDAPHGSSATPLLLAAQFGHASCAALVLDAAPDALRAVDAAGRTALMLAASSGSEALVELLVERGLPIDGAGEHDGRTALMWAIIAHKPAVVGALARLGADPTVRAKLSPEAVVIPGKPDREGDTAMDLAEARAGKDPTLRHIATFVKDWLKRREEEPGAPAPTMPPLPWVAHAEAFVARGGEEAAAPEVAATGEADKVESDIFDDDDAEEDAEEEAEEEEEPAENFMSKMVPAAMDVSDKGAATAAMAAAAASAADLDELD